MLDRTGKFHEVKQLSAAELERVLQEKLEKLLRLRRTAIEFGLKFHDRGAAGNGCGPASLAAGIRPRLLQGERSPTGEKLRLAAEVSLPGGVS